MSIARAFTTRRVKQSLDMKDGPDSVHRSNTTKAPLSIRHKISAPVELIHTTNMLSYNAPDLFPKSAASSHNSTKSDDESDAALTTASITPPTSPDSPFPEKRSLSPEPNHLSCYFTAPNQAISTASVDAPAIPKRAPSHTKKSYDGLVRHRSTSRLSEQSQRSISLSTKASFSFSRSSSTSTSTSMASSASPSTIVPHVPKLTAPVASSHSVPPVSHKKEYSDSHPFGHELAQVSELAEEFSVKQQLSVMDEEERELRQKGFKKFSAEEYLGEIQGLLSSIFAENQLADRQPVAALWI